jgi:hypothetical protein
MIQRIQTVYLFLGALLSILVLFIPVYSDVRGLDSMFIMIAAIADAVLSLVVIGMFKNRIQQLGLGKILLFISSFFLGIVLFEAFNNGQAFTFGTFIPLIVNLLNLLAMRGIRADERLVRESDRLR